MPPAHIKSGQIIALFAFDVGYEIDLQLLDTKLLYESGPTRGGDPI
ncbi:MAG TPA: hypothetical protein VFR80_07015 [Pyrinomonadaceae bacterium]|nr:hypothetical protein [Pyrinomonadaceae bacterium]